jgi:CBS domain-containing membrane protein
VALENLKVRDVMSTEVVTIGRNDKLAIADDVMKQERIRHMPVLNADDDVCGIITQRDLFRGALIRALGFGTRAEEMMLNNVVVKEVMSKEVQTISPDTPIRDAAKLMIERKIGCLPVVEGDKLIGILTEGDFVKLAAGVES